MFYHLFVFVGMYALFVGFIVLFTWLAERRDKLKNKK
jgi:hypothetical protein